MVNKALWLTLISAICKCGSVASFNARDFFTCFMRVTTPPLNMMWGITHHCSILGVTGLLKSWRINKSNQRGWVKDTQTPSGPHRNRNASVFQCALSVSITSEVYPRYTAILRWAPHWGTKGGTKSDIVALGCLSGLDSTALSARAFCSVLLYLLVPLSRWIPLHTDPAPGARQDNWLIFLEGMMANRKMCLKQNPAVLGLHIEGFQNSTWPWETAFRFAAKGQNVLRKPSRHCIQINHGKITRC